jgi:hypothetical protein
MNCKPGDLAVLVYSRIPRYIGEIYVVLRPYDGTEFASNEPAWVIEHRGEEWHCEDRHLRPIRDPGDDAVDEFARTKVTTLDACEPVLHRVAA